MDAAFDAITVRLPRRWPREYFHYSLTLACDIDSAPAATQLPASMKGAAVFVNPPLDRPAFRLALESFAKGVVCTLCWLLAGTVTANAGSIPLKSAEASFQGGDAAALAKVIDGVEAGPEG